MRRTRRATANPEAGDLIRESGGCPRCDGPEPKKAVACGIYFNRLSNPLLAHFRLPIAPEHFARWLTLFAEAANEVMTSTPCSVGCA
jgi:hypothetical protein